MTLTRPLFSQRKKVGGNRGQLDARRALRPTALLPLAAERKLAQVIGFESERLVPFKPSEIYFAYRFDIGARVAERGAP
jgi:hypothetical protein